MPKIIGQYFRSQCYACGDIEPDESWDIHVRCLEKDEKEDNLVVRKTCCKECMAHYLISWGESILNGRIPSFQNYDHEKQTAKIQAHRG